MTAKFNPRPGDAVQHKEYRSLGTGVIVEPVAPRLPSLPAREFRVKFGTERHVTRTVHVDNLMPAETLSFGGHKTQLVAVDGGLVA